MDFSIFQSLKQCSLTEVKEGLESAKQNVEFYVDHVEPNRFKELNFFNDTSVYLTTTSKIITSEDDDYINFFHQVLYESLHLDIDLKKMQSIKIWKAGVMIALILTTLFLIIYPCSELGKSMMFFATCALAWGLYQLYQFKVEIEVSKIKRKTNFKLLEDKKLETLPSIYIVDNKTMYLGANLLNGNEKDSFFLVESFEDQVALKTIYRDYAKNSNSVTEEFLISNYLRIVGRTT